MGLAKVLLGRGSKEGGLSKCARVDSLGLARRRLAAKAAEEAGADADVIAAGEKDDFPAGQEEVVDDQDASEAIILNLMGRQHRDSLRLHRRRFRERASLDLPRSSAKNDGPEKGMSWSSGCSPRAGAGQDDDQDADPVADGVFTERASDPASTLRHVRFRRASEGEYLNASRSHKGSEGAIPHALKAVQMKAERLFRRLTANFTESHPPRPRSGPYSRGGSPTRPHRISASRVGSTSRSSASWGLSLRHRSVDASSASAGAGGAADDGRVSPTTAAARIVAAAGADEDDAVAGGSRPRRHGRQSAPGELFFSSIVDGSAAATAAEPSSPEPLSPPSSLRTKSVTKDVGGAGPAGISPGGGGGKGLNWLARLSRGLSSSHGPSAYKVAAAGPGAGTAGAAAAGPGPTGEAVEPAEATKGAREQQRLQQQHQHQQQYRPQQSPEIQPVL